MEYRTLPRGGERIGVLGIGTGGIQNNSGGETFGEGGRLHRLPPL